ncbi:MAG: Na(+)-translocating NADH-quinone reductase subunit A [Candidatus Neomarinimicrobiota bacterium]
MNHINIKKGHDLQIKGSPESNISSSIMVDKVAVSPNSFRSIKPKLIVSEGDTVNVGSPLFYDKLKPDVKWASPACGTITSIQFGPRRVIEKIEITIEENKIEPFEILSDLQFNSANHEKILDYILKANLFPLIRQRPFNKIANPKDVPRDIFISGYNTAPLSIDLLTIIHNEKESFQIGLNALSKLTDGKVFLTSESPMEFDNVINQTISGPHPAGNVGIQIHHIKPLKPGHIVWTVNAEHVITIGRLFQTGLYDSRCIVSIGGSGASAPQTVEAIAGSSIKSLLKNQNLDKPVRIVSGDILTGKSVELNDYLGYYDSSLTIINDEVNRPFLGMFTLGSGSEKYSLTNTFLSMKAKEFDFTTSQNGELRAMVPLNAWENVLPMDIMPNPLYRSILAQDIEEMEKLGIWECDDEDFALCSFACPSKIDVGSVIRDGLNLLEDEG